MRELSAKQMIDIQVALDYEITGGKKISFRDTGLASIAEAVELLESTTWKWWAKNKFRKDENVQSKINWNAEIEAIDILHFSLSSWSQVGIPKADKVTSCGKWEKSDSGIEYFLTNRRGFRKFCCKILMDTATIDDISQFIRGGRDRVSAIYVAKCTLNWIRTRTGYKDGTYKKVTDGVEDNELLEKIVESFCRDSGKTLSSVSMDVFDAFGMPPDMKCPAMIKF